MLSVIVPSYNSRALAVSSSAQLCEYLAAHFDDYEVILVDDGSRVEERVSPGELPERAQLLQLERNRGKGAAVQAGMMLARGRVRLFTDVDLPYDLKAIPYAYAQITERGFNAVFGDRQLAASCIDTTMPALRHVTSWTLRKLIAVFVVGGMGDTQCGFKAFSGALAELLFPLLRIHGFGFDVELYYILAKHDIQVLKIPVRLVNCGESSVAPIQVSAVIAASILSLPVHHRLGLYDCPALRALEGGVYWER